MNGSRLQTNTAGCWTVLRSPLLGPRASACLACLAAGLLRAAAEPSCAELGCRACLRPGLLALGPRARPASPTGLLPRGLPGWAA